MLAFLAATTASPGGGLSNEVVTLAYVLTSIATVGAMIAGVRRYVTKQRDKWTEEGRAREEGVRVTRENSERLQANTQAITGLADKFGDFATNVHDQFDDVKDKLSVHGRRIDRLEDRQGIGHPRSTHADG